MRFDETYFNGEYRHGFYVSGMMKRNWAAHMEILEVIKDVCQKHDIRYFAEWGTLLGAVRHKGFVPWDDDLDIGMLREDFRKFQRVAKEALPKGYQVLSIYTDDTYDDLLLHVVNSRELSYEDEWLERFHGCPYATGIDIFPVDYVPRDPADWEFQKNMIVLLLNTANYVKAGTVSESDLQEILEEIQKISGITIDRTREVGKQLIQLTEAFFALYTDEDADLVASIPDLARGSHKAWSKHCYDQMLEVPFETTTIAIPAGYDEILKAKYGDYMRMIRGWGTHNYPCYRKQEELLRKHFCQNHIQPPAVLQKELERTTRYMDTSIPVEIADFKRIREKEFYYVDKTGLLLERPEEKHRIWKIMKPERFGKSLITNMFLHYHSVLFDEIGRPVSYASLFQGLKVEEGQIPHGEYVCVGLGFRSYLMPDYEATIERIRMMITLAYNACAAALESDQITAKDREFFEKIREGSQTEEDCLIAYRVLGTCLCAAYGRKLIVNFEDLDSLLMHARLHGFYEKMASFAKALILATTEGENAPALVFLTGRFEIDGVLPDQWKETENIGCISVTNGYMEEYFGYTQEEVREMFQAYQMEEQLETAREWFGGYGLSGELYNPWSINNYIASVCNGATEPYPYWLEASTDELRKELMKRTAPMMEKEIKHLLDGGYLEKPIRDTIKPERLFQDVDEVWNYLFLTGCLTTRRIEESNGGLIAALQIPNEECRRFFEAYVSKEREE